MQNAVPNPDTAPEPLELARAALESANDFEQAAQLVNSTALATTFREYANERARFAEELRIACENEPARGAGTSVLEPRLPLWRMDLRGLGRASGNTAILAEAARAADELIAAYESVLLETAGRPVHDVLHAQHRRVKASRDQIRALRDACES